MDKCLSALEAQTIAPAEIIIVDDCSTDDSFERLQEYKEKTKLNIVLLKNEKNLGPGISRKKAIDTVIGDYIAFCDCDDWYDCDFIETVSKEIKSKVNTDVVIFDYYKVYSNQSISAGSTINYLKSEKNEILANVKMSLCCFVVKKEIMQSVVCPPLYHGEDGAVTPQIIAKSENISVLDRSFYNYLYREGSVSFKPSPTGYKELVEAFRVVKTELPEKYYDECEYIGIKYVCYGAVLSAFKAGVDRTKVFSILDEFEKDYPNWISNKYICNLGKIKNLYLLFIKKRMLLFVSVMSSLHDYYIKLRKK